jgi:hypothetical protein
VLSAATTEEHGHADAVHGTTVSLEAFGRV